MAASVGVIVLVCALSGFGVHRLVLSRRLDNVARLRAAADEALWRRHNVIGDMIPWAANEGDPATEALFTSVVAARDAVMACRADRASRLAAEDRLQTALNAFYLAAYRDEGLLSVHEWVVAAAHALRADVGAAEAVKAHDTAANQFLVRRPSWLLALYRLDPPKPFRLTVRYLHPSPVDQPLA
ncbi:MAG: hypothetical protein FJX59_01330 [Alphaproteobacteria bacterium]|nr:hypothetical protein [Alphaproteobacteria bacterium]